MKKFYVEITLADEFRSFFVEAANLLEAVNKVATQYPDVQTSRVKVV